MSSNSFDIFTHKHASQPDIPISDDLRCGDSCRAAIIVCALPMRFLHLTFQCKYIHSMTLTILDEESRKVERDIWTVGRDR